MYQHTSGITQSISDLKYALISVLPKSSFIGIRFFFHAYTSMLLNEPYEKAYDHPDSAYVFKKAEFRILHLPCPDFRAHVTADQFAAWAELKYTDMIHWDMSNVLESNSHMHHLSAENRVVFIYRNPLDQLISSYFYLQDVYPGASLEEFVFKHSGLDAYLKMFYTYHLLKDKFPNNILFVPYEDLMRDRKSAMLHIINYLDIPYDASAFDAALAVTTLDGLKKQQAIDISNNSAVLKHFRDGSVGQWQTHMTPELVQRIEARLQEFGLSLKMFHLADHLEAEFAFIHHDKKRPTPRLTLNARPFSMKI